MSYGVVSSINQVDDSIAAQMTKEGHILHPTHLTRALYLPHHDTTVSRLNLYDISASYDALARSLSFGSSRYIVALGMLQKPQGEGTAEVPIEYSVQFQPRNHSTSGVVGLVESCQSPSLRPVQVEVAIPAKTDNNVGILRLNGGSEDPISTSYPIPPSTTRDGTFLHPFFTFNVPDEEGKLRRTLEWQIDPPQDGRMRYTLVDITKPDRRDTLAIYQHIGTGPSLALRYSEGALLLPCQMNSKVETMVVGSLLAMLWRLRSLRKDAQRTVKLKVKGFLRGDH